MTRILSYNILVGGTQRIDQLTGIIQSTYPDIIGLVEATNPQVVEELANRLGMEFRLTGQGKRAKDWQLAVLSRFPIIQARVQKPSLFVPYPDLGTLSPLRRYITKQTMHTILRSKLLSALVDWISPVYAQGGIDLLLKAGYVDCFRRVNPRSPGFTCPAAAPAGRIDFIFASPEVAQRLSNCCVVTEGEGVHGEEASDHLPVCAEFD
jgi:endonuclease/exonuclease/phosphatase family metal-dependent hydrolase